LRVKQAMEEVRFDHFVRFIDADGIHEVMFVPRIARTECRRPFRERGDDGLSLTVREDSFRMITIPTLGGFEIVHHLIDWDIDEFWPGSERTTFGGDTPIPAVCLVAVRMTERSLIMSNDRVIPVRHVNGAVRSDLHIDRTEARVRG